jgi:hypothetical protein
LRDSMRGQSRPLDLVRIAGLRSNAFNLTAGLMWCNVRCLDLQQTTIEPARSLEIRRSIELKQVVIGSTSPDFLVWLLKPAADDNGRGAHTLLLCFGPHTPAGTLDALIDAIRQLPPAQPVVRLSPAHLEQVQRDRIQQACAARQLRLVWEAGADV